MPQDMQLKEEEKIVGMGKVKKTEETKDVLLTENPQKYIDDQVEGSKNVVGALSDRIAYLESVITKFVTQTQGYTEDGIPIRPPVSKEQVTRTHQDKMEATRVALMAEEQVMIMIPLTPGEDTKSQHPFIINGLRINVPKGRMVRVPETIATLYSESVRATEEAFLNPLRLDMRSKDDIQFLGM